ncbi:hypothetical protein [Pseudomonas iridis]|uniref:hypothetical protein n=1 Tax=Pseudomonas iridis TaxID=2710587 RepID=UPI001E65106F|nr:hypothetical protein [Pseudomonas iridis]
MTFTARVSPPQMVQALALLAALVGVATWSSLLLTSAESHTPSAAPQLLAARSDSPALQWFSNQTAPVDIKVSGVMAGSRGAVAILSLNDGPPRSFLQTEVSCVLHRPERFWSIMDSKQEGQVAAIRQYSPFGSLSLRERARVRGLLQSPEPPQNLRPQVNSAHFFKEFT